MEDTKAKELLSAERPRVEGLLKDIDEAGADDRTAADQEGEMYDSAEPLTTEGTDDAVRAGLEERLAAIDRAEQRLAAGTYGVSVRSGQPIPDDRLEADPTAELTVEEAAERSRVSALLRRLPVLGVGEAPPPVGLARDLIRSQAPFRQDPGDPADDAGLGGHVDVPDAGGKIHAATACEQRVGIARHRPAGSVEPAHVESIRRRRLGLLLVGGRVDLEHAVATDPGGSASIIASAPGSPVSSATKSASRHPGAR